MNFCFEFLNIHMNEKGTTCDDYYGFKWQKHKYFLNYYYYLLSSDAFFDSFDCDYTHFVCVENC